MRTDDFVLRTPMHDQLFAPIENATDPRMVYPEEPSAALTTSIAARRELLVSIPHEPTRPPQGITVDRSRLGPFASEVKR